LNDLADNGLVSKEDYIREKIKIEYDNMLLHHFLAQTFPDDMIDAIDIYKEYLEITFENFDFYYAYVVTSQDPRIEGYGHQWDENFQNAWNANHGIAPPPRVKM
jgi:hypothetical protein